MECLANLDGISDQEGERNGRNQSMDKVAGENNEVGCPFEGFSIAVGTYRAELAGSEGIEVRHSYPLQASRFENPSLI